MELKKLWNPKNIILLILKMIKCVIFHMKNDIFDQDYVAKIKIPEKEQDIKEQVNNLTKIVSKIKEKVNINEQNDENKEEKKEEIENEPKDDIKGNKLDSFLNKEDTAKSSFFGTLFLQNEEKILISEWIHPKKIIKFNLLYNNDKDSDGCSYFHYNCDGFFPTVTVILDTSGRRFGGYSTQSWSQSPVGGNYARAPGSFIFNLSNKKKYDLQDPLCTNAIYRNNSYGPTFGGGHDLYISDGCKPNTSSSCTKSNYITGNVNLLGEGGNTNFQVSNFEVYQVIFE